MLWVLANKHSCPFRTELTLLNKTAGYTCTYKEETFFMQFQQRNTLSENSIFDFQSKKQIWP